MSFLRENSVKMYKRKVVSKYNFILQEIEKTNSILERAKSEIDEKVGMFLKGGDDSLAAHFAEIDQDLEAFHNKLCFIQDVLEDDKLSIENNIACNSSNKSEEIPPDIQNGTSGSSQIAGNLGQAESLSSTSQNDQIFCSKNDFSELLTSQLNSRSEKEINTKLDACAIEPDAFCNDTHLHSVTLASNISTVQNNVKMNTVHNIKETNIERNKFLQNDKNNIMMEHVSSSDGSSVYDTVSSVCSEVLTVDKSEIVTPKDFGKQNNGGTSVFQGNRDDCHPEESLAASEWSSNEDSLRTVSVGHSSTIDIPYPDLRIGSHITAAIQVITNPSDFWIQLDNIHTKELCPVPNGECCDELLAVKKNIYCLAPLKQPGKYFRAKILDLSGKNKQRTKVLYVDVGCIGSPASSTLKVLPAPLQSIPSAAVHCALHGVVPVNGKWSYKAIEEFRNTIEVSDIKILVCSRVNDTYFVQVSITADIPGNKMFTYNMADMLCEFNFAVREHNVANAQLDAVLSPASLSPSSTMKLPSPSSASNNLSNMNNSDNFPPAKNVLSNNIPCDHNSLKHGFQQEVLSNKELESSISVNNEGDRRSVIDNFIAQNVQVNVQNISNHQKSAMTNPCREAVVESNSDVNTKLPPCESANVVNCSVVPTIDSDTASHNMSVSNFPCITTDSCSGQKVSQNISDDFDWNVNIPFPSQKFEKKAKFVVMLSAIISPSDFYVNLAMPNSTELDDLQEQMLSVYQNLDTSKIILPSVDKLCGMFCSCQFAEDKNWYRAQVLGLCDSEEKGVRVQYIDYGNETEVDAKDLIPLKKEFALHPAFSFHCSLAGIKPKVPESSSHVNGEDNAWSAEAVSRFKCLTSFDKCYTAEIADTVIYDKRKNPLPVYLWDTVSSRDILINAILVEQGAADGSDLELLYSQGEDNQDIDKWDPMGDDYHSILNSYGVNMNDPEVATVGYKATDETYVCKYFAKSGKCFRGDRCYYQHIFTFGDSTIDKVPVEFLGENIPLPAVDSTVFVMVSAMFNPSHFYVVFPFGTKSVESIQSEIRRCTYKEGDVTAEFIDNMNKYYNRGVHRKENTALVPACGDLIAVKWKKDGQWYRGRVCDVLDTTAPVLTYFLDFGNCEVIERENVRELEVQFRHFPFQAVECQLHGIEPKSSEEGQMWSNKSKVKFQEVTEGKVLVARVKGIYGSSLYVELFLCAQDKDFSISEYLIRNGYGQLPQPRSSNNSVSSHGSQKSKQNKNVVFIPA